MAASKRRQRDLVNQIAESAVVQDDLDAVVPATPAKKAARKRKAAKKTGRKKAAKKVTKPAKKARRKTTRKPAKKPAKKAAKKTTKRASKKAAKSSRGNTPTKGPKSVRGNNEGQRKGENVKSHRASSAEKKARTNLKEPTPDRTCQAKVHVKGAEPKGCTRWTMKLEGGGFDDYCHSHSNTERAALVRQKGADNLRGANEDRAAGAELEELFQTPIDTQDDVARERMNLARHAVNPDKAQRLAATAAGITAQLLKDMSAHIERYGSHQGKEGGHSIMRLLPGATIVEANFEYDRVFTKDDYHAIMEGMVQDEKDGIAPARDVSEQALRYLGRVVRPRDRSRYDTEQGAFDE